MGKVELVLEKISIDFAHLQDIQKLLQDGLSLLA
jgi:hypothetical protein